MANGTTFYFTSRFGDLKPEALTSDELIVYSFSVLDFGVVFLFYYGHFIPFYTAELSSIKFLPRYQRSMLLSRDFIMINQPIKTKVTSESFKT
jgi:hypothetical protein